MKILVTGSEGFIGKNLLCKLNTLNNLEIALFNRGSSDSQLEEAIKKTECIVHLAGENRPNNDHSFIEGNVLLTEKICHLLNKHNLHVPIIFASSIKAQAQSAYGKSKLTAEKLITKYSEDTDSSAIIFRLPGVFGKWCKPNYNSVIATFCHNIARGIPISIHDTQTTIYLVYIDDVVSEIIRSIFNPALGLEYRTIGPEYSINLGDLAKRIHTFNSNRSNLEINSVGSGLNHALYSTYISYLPKEEFAYAVPAHIDDRGTFIEMLKTEGCGQISLITSKPGVARGKHYHDSKTEKFLVIKGSAKFRFENIQTRENYELNVCSDKPTIVQTIPGWAHEIINTGPDELIAIIWANEIFDRSHPDTYRYEMTP
jgi:UDP-2-acetamido-2,6-beta-L-arabino-hexul-4-ose reductase